jgi:endonuclease YncB( thermonuclease family)
MKFLFGTLLCFLLAFAQAGEQLTGRATKVFDGDSFVVKLDSGGEIEVRLGDIDAPEKDQPHAARARAALRDLILNRKLLLDVIDVDPYKRKVCYVRLGSSGLFVNAEMVKRGHAWVYRRWVRDKSFYELEQQARQEDRGLWALPESQHTPPWKWRQQHPPTRKPAAQPRLGASESAG